MRPAHIRVIFTLPTPLFQVYHPLIYVHWFCPLRQPDPVAGLPPTSHSLRQSRQNAAVVLLNHLVRSCHLIPRLISNGLEHQDVQGDMLDESLTFYFNHYLDFHTSCYKQA